MMCKDRTDTSASRRPAFSKPNYAITPAVQRGQNRPKQSAIPMQQAQEAVIDWERFSQARAALGANFLRSLGFFRKDGQKSLIAMENALREGNPVGVIGPADLLKTDAMQLGALTVAEMAEDIEFGARNCVDWHQSPGILIEPVLALCRAFQDTVLQLDQAVNPLANRKVA
jgi:histidine phosphotransfer protein HptB